MGLKFVHMHATCARVLGDHLYITFQYASRVFSRMSLPPPILFGLNDVDENDTILRSFSTKPVLISIVLKSSLKIILN